LGICTIILCLGSCTRYPCLSLHTVYFILFLGSLHTYYPLFGLRTLIHAWVFHAPLIVISFFFFLPHVILLQVGFATRYFDRDYYPLYLFGFAHLSASLGLHTHELLELRIYSTYNGAYSITVASSLPLSELCGGLDAQEQIRNK
jgi:hypothetical protein